jgi:purine-binding chemotaxis protein CheW
MSQFESTSFTLADSVSASKNSSQFVGFFIDEQEYAFPIQQIQEIVMPGKVTRTPQVADYVDGVSNLRGTIIPIINLRRLFGLESKPTDESTRTVVVNVGTRTMGCVVDSVTQVIRIPQESIQPPPEVIVGRETAYISGFAKLDDRLLVVLNIDELLHPEKLDEVQRLASQARESTESPAKLDA